MRKHFTLYAAALAAGTLAYAGYDSSLLAADPDPGSSMTTPGRSDAASAVRAELPQGITRSQQSDVQGIRKTLASVTDAAFSDNATNVQKYLSSDDRQRLGDLGKTWDKDMTKRDQLKNTITQFRNDWKAKYGQDFSLSGKEQVVFGPQFRDFQIVQGEVSNPALLSNWPIEPATRTDMDRGTREPGAMKDMPGTGSEKGSAAAGSPAAGKNIEQGQNVAIVTFPTEAGAPELTVSLDREKKATGDWRIDLPDTITADKLRDNLQNHINACNQMKNQWPDDVNQAYRIASHHVLMSFYDTGTGRNTGAGSNPDKPELSDK